MSVQNDQKISLVQVKSDIIMAEKAIAEAKAATPKLSKYMKGQAGYHIQQATEKLIKYLIYNSGVKTDNAKMYKHSINDLITYANTLGIDIVIPEFIDKHAIQITSWEAEGRYNIHFVARIDTLEKHLAEVKKWYDTVL